MRCCNRMIYFIVHYKQQWQQQTFLRSTHCVSITMTATFSCQIILQKSTTVFCRQPCAAMYLWMPSASCSVHYTPTYHQYRHRSGLGIHSKSQTDCGLMKHGVCHGVLNCVSKKWYHPSTINNFNSSCPIPEISGTNIPERICQRKVVYFLTSPA